MTIEKTFEILKENHQKDWLLSVEIAELLDKENETELFQKVIIHLEKVKQNRPEIAHLISGGLELIFEKESV